MRNPNFITDVSRKWNWSFVRAKIKIFLRNLEVVGNKIVREKLQMCQGKAQVAVVELALVLEKQVASGYKKNLRHSLCFMKFTKVL